MKAIRIVLTIFLLIGILPATACRKQPPPMPVETAAPVGPDYLEHRVAYSGETLAIIAKHYTGKTSNWNAILQANPGLKPERIRIGQVIQIPRDLLVTDKPLPKTVMKVPVETAPASTETTTEPAAAEPDRPISVETAGTATAAAPVAAVEPVKASEPPAEAATEPPKPVKTETDIEREKLLDELLKSQ